MYGKTNLKKLKEYYEKSQKKGLLSDKFWKPKEGTSIIRILPPVEGEELFFYKTGYHYLDSGFYWCPKVTKGSRCPICEHTRKLYESKDVEEAKRIKARKVFLYNIIDREDQTKTPKIFMCGVKLHDKLVSFYFDDDFGPLDDIKNGYDIKVIKTITAGYPNYDMSRPVKNPSPLAESEDEIYEILQKLHNLSEVVELKTPEELSAAIQE